MKFPSFQCALKIIIIFFSINNIINLIISKLYNIKIVNMAVYNKANLKTMGYELSGNQNANSMIIFLHGWPDNCRVCNFLGILFFYL